MLMKMNAFCWLGEALFHPNRSTVLKFNAISIKQRPRILQQLISFIVPAKTISSEGATEMDARTFICEHAGSKNNLAFGSISDCVREWRANLSICFAFLQLAPAIFLAVVGCRRFPLSSSAAFACFRTPALPHSTHFHLIRARLGEQLRILLIIYWSERRIEVYNQSGWHLTLLIQMWRNRRGERYWRKGEADSYYD